MQKTNQKNDKKENPKKKKKKLVPNFLCSQSSGSLQ